MGWGWPEVDTCTSFNFNNEMLLIVVIEANGRVEYYIAIVIKFLS